MNDEPLKRERGRWILGSGLTSREYLCDQPYTREWQKFIDKWIVPAMRNYCDEMNRETNKLFSESTAGRRT